MRNLQSQLEQAKTRLDDLTRLLYGYSPQQFSAFDLAGTPISYEVLCRQAGSWAGISVPAQPTPFAITLSPDPSTPGALLATVGEGTVMLSGKPDNNLSVSGLGSAFSTNPGSSGTAEGTVLDIFALYIVVAGYVATSATIQSQFAETSNFDPTLAAWEPSDQSYVFDDGGTPPSQIGINVLLGYTIADATGNPFLIQCQTTHVLLENSFIDSEPAIFDFSHRERYGITAP